MDELNRNCFFCSCGCEILVASYDSAYRQLDLSMFSRGTESTNGWWQKLRYCWRVLIKGSPYLDSMILDDVGIYNLRNYLNKLAITTEDDLKK